MPNRDGVIINVYVETRNLRSNRQTDPIKRINPKQISTQPRVFKTRGYDRRAQLLSYAQELRQADAQQLQWPLKNSRWKPPKKWRWKDTMEKIKRLFSLSDGIKRKWKYESIVTDGYSDGEGLYDQERMKKRRRRGGRRRRHSNFCASSFAVLRATFKKLKSEIFNFV